MFRLPFTRLIAVGFVAIVAFAAPGAALAHGTAHHRELTGSSHHAPANLVHAVGEAEISAPDHDADHQHPRLDEVSRTRTEGTTLVLALQVRAPEARLAPARQGILTPHGSPPRADPDTGPPPRLRAPPAR